MDTKTAILQAILFASGEPIDGDKLAQSAEMSKKEFKQEIKKLETALDGTGIKLLKLENSYQLATREEYASYIKNALEVKKNTPLSQAAMEALTIIAYNQPVTKSFVEQVRGVDTSSVINSLVEKDLLCEAGRLDLPGRPIAYKTTDNFLRCFQLSSPADLPPLEDKPSQVTIDEILDERENLNEEV